MTCSSHNRLWTAGTPPLTSAAVGRSDRPLTSVSSFKYLGRVLSASDDDWPAVIRNLWRARQKWERLSRVLGREGSYARKLGMFNIVVVQAVLLYSSEAWVMSPRIRRTLGGYHHRVVKRMTGRILHRNLDETWMYPSLEEAMSEVGVQEVETHVARRKNTVTQFIATRPIMDLCMAAARRPGARVSKRWR